MTKEKYDIAIIGAGPGGYVAALHAAKYGFKTVCIDKRKELGGTCLNVGCIPSKALLQSSEAYAFIQKQAENHGINTSNLSFDLPHMMQRKEEIVAGLVKGIEGLFQRNQITSITGKAHFISPHEIKVSEQHIEAKYFIIATGSEPIALPFLPFDEKKVLSSTGALSLSHTPKTMAVIGAGVIGVELASVYSRLGSEVTIVEMLDHICPAMDAAVSKNLLSLLKKQGMTFRLSTQVNSADLSKDPITLELSEGTLDAEVVLVAVGRKPYTQGLGLEEIGITTTKKGFIPVNQCFRTKHSHIFAIGDVIEGMMLAHLASDEGVAVVDLIAGKRSAINYLAIPNVIYTHPEVAALGVTEQQAKDLGISIKTGISQFRANPRARCSGDMDGFVKVIGDKATDRLIGMHIIGAHASELIGEGVMAIEKKMTLKEIAYASHAHPALAETIKEAALASTI